MFKYDDWFSGVKQYFDTFLTLDPTQELHFLEIGSYEGRSTKYLLDKFLQHEKSTITCVDSWKGGMEHSNINMDDVFESFKHNLLPNDKVLVKRGKSIERLALMLDYEKQYDFVYIDGGHTIEDVISDIVLAFPLLKPNGIMAFDDYMWGSEWTPSIKTPDHLRPQFAIDLFLCGWKDKITLLRQANQVWIRKNGT